jgi:Fe-S cluster biosynthesis and repair protein YggX
VSTVNCGRCGRAEAPALARAPMPGALGRQVLAHVCADCWAEWERAEVMVINELRLNLIDPAAQTTLMGHLREFLQLRESEG